MYREWAELSEVQVWVERPILEKMFVSVTAIEDSESTNDSILGYLLSEWRDGDVYLQLSALGLAVFVLLCCLIGLAWMHYGSVISTVFDARSWSQFLSYFLLESS